MKVISLITTIFMSAVAYGEQQPFDPAQSQIIWKGSKVVGGEHEGTIVISSGFLKVENTKPVEARVVVDMSSIVNTDLKDPKWNKQLVDHLHSDDFFSTKSYPEASIHLTKFEPQKDGKLKLSGNLTIKGTTKPVELYGELKGESGLLSSLIAKLEFDRTEFGIRYGSGKFFENLGDKMISDTVEVRVDLRLKSPIKVASNK